MLLIILVPVACFLLVSLVVSVIAAIKLDKAGLKAEKKVRHRRKTFDDGLGKYTVDITEEETVVVPKNN